MAKDAKIHVMVDELSDDTLLELLEEANFDLDYKEKRRELLELVREGYADGSISGQEIFSAWETEP